MKKLAIASLFVLAATGAFGQFVSNRVRLLGNIPLQSMPGSPSSGAGASGWVSPNGREYGIMGVRTGTVIVDITNPTSPELLNLITGSQTLWHESTTMNGYGYFVSDSVGEGMQIVDLKTLDATRSANLVATYTGGGLTTVHTIQADPATKTLFLNGSNRGFVILDATNPTAPVELGRWTDHYVHDCVVANYTSGPFAGRQIVFACSGGMGLYVLDVTNRSNIVVLGSLAYIPNGGYCHSGLLTPDKHYFLINDEFDESNGIEDSCTTHVIDVSDLTHPVESTQFHNPIQVIDHNSTQQDGVMFLAAYKGGLRVYDHSNPLSISELGFIDTYPEGDGFAYEGDWGLAGGFPSGNIVMSDINRGFFVVDPSEAKGWGAPILSVLSARSVNDPEKKLRRPDSSTVNFSPGDSYQVTLQTTSQARSLVDVTLRARRTAGQITAMVDAKNVSTGLFDRILTFAVPDALTDVTVANLAGGQYIDTSGKIVIRVRLLANGSSARGELDMVRTLVH